jgi:hypothetical protein
MLGRRTLSVWKQRGILDNAQLRKLYFRMAVGAVSGAAITGILGYAWAAWNNNLNPVAGLGLVFLCSVGMAVGMFVGLFTRTRRRDQ